MLEKFSLKCCAKINLSLDVINRREDGYHNLEMLMQAIDISDELTVTADRSAVCGVEISCGGDIFGNECVPQNADNLAARAAALFMEETGIRCGIKIEITKHIPVGAGLGGGSSDAAGTLSAMNRLFGKPLSYSALAGIAAKIGSDVPFFLTGGCMLAEGIGTKLSPLPRLSGVTVVVAKPPFGVSTPHVYKNLRLDCDVRHPDTRGAIRALESGSLAALAACCGNVLETVTAAEHAEIDEYKKIMNGCGAVYSLMSGSGPTVFGIFEDEEDAAAAHKIFREKTREVYICRPCAAL